jgi:hypothetical protein
VSEELSQPWRGKKGSKHMNSWTAKLEKWFGAVAFAEAGEHATAMQMVGLRPRAATAREGVLQRFSTAFAAVAFAEENCPEMARDILSPAKPMRSFAQLVGLEGVRIWQGVVSYSEESFFDVVGLKGAKMRLGVVSL